MGLGCPDTDHHTVVAHMARAVPVADPVAAPVVVPVDVDIPRLDSLAGSLFRYRMHKGHSLVVPRLVAGRNAGSILDELRSYHPVARTMVVHVEQIAQSPQSSNVTNPAMVLLESPVRVSWLTSQKGMFQIQGYFAC